MVDVFIKSFLLVRKQLEIVEISVRVLRSKINTTSVAISLEAEADQERGEGEERSGGRGRSLRSAPCCSQGACPY